MIMRIVKTTVYSDECDNDDVMLKVPHDLRIIMMTVSVKIL